MLAQLLIPTDYKAADAYLRQTSVYEIFLQIVFTMDNKPLAERGHHNLFPKVCRVYTMTPSPAPPLNVATQLFYGKTGSLFLSLGNAAPVAPEVTCLKTD